MNYESFNRAFIGALQETSLGLLSQNGEDLLDPGTLDREFRVHVQLVGGEVSHPFRVSASISFRWDALLTARMATCEEDLLHELQGHEIADRIQTEQPRVRVDIKLRAGLDWGSSLPMPSRNDWVKWARESFTRLESIERIVSEDVMREIPGSLPEVLAWQGDPEIRLRCTSTGELRLEEVSVTAFQGIDLPRQWDDPDRESDEDPHAQLTDMFERVRAVLYAWGEIADHLLPTPRS